VSKGRRYHRDVLKFREKLEKNLLTLQEQLKNKSYSPGSYRTFRLYEPKERIIYVAPIRDRIVHHAIMNIVEPIWDSLFIYDSYACRKGKGTHAGVRRIAQFLRSANQKWPKAYCLKGDISKFFPSINHHIMLRIIAKKIKCPDALWLFEQIIFANGNKDDPDSKNMPIGNLISQWCANLYLNELDQYIKHTLKIEYYLRYMDDFAILGSSSEELHKIKKEISSYLNNCLRLSLNSKTDIYPVNRGIDFMGYRIWHNNILIRKSSLVRATRRFKKLSKLYSEGVIDLYRAKSSLFSWLGHCKHANARKGIELCLRYFILRRKDEHGA